MSGVRGGGREELPHVRGQGLRLGGATPRPGSGAAAGRSYPLRGRRRTKRNYFMFKVRRGDLVQGKEQRRCFAGEAVKRYPTSKVRETQVKTVGVARGHQRADALKP